MSLIISGNPPTSDDIRDAAVLANAAYDRSTAGNPVPASANLVGTGWTYVNPADLGIAAGHVDAEGFLSVQGTDPVSGIAIDVQVLLARKGSSTTLAIAFRGTSSFTDLINDVLGAVGGFGRIYNGADALITTILLNASAAFGATRILVAGHSLGGAMTEELMARHNSDARLVGVTFGSPGVNDADVADEPGSDPRLLNIGHESLDVPLFLNPLTVVGDPVYRQTPFEHVQGSDIRVFLPDEPEMTLVELALSKLAGTGTGQHETRLYIDTAAAMAREADLIAALGLPASVRDFGFVRGTAPAGSVLTGSNGINVLIGAAGLDILAGLAGSDIMDGGAGTDMADYARDAGNGGGAAVYVDLGGGIAIDGFGDIDKLVDIESVRGSNAAFAAGETWADLMVGSDGDNLFEGLAGNDIIDGMGGEDTVSYADDAQFGGGSGVWVDLAKQLGMDGFGDVDFLISMEDVVGTDGTLAGLPGFSDVISGDDGRNRLDGRGGNDCLAGRGGDDTLLGGAGNDTLDGGSGSNTLTGGTGDDTFLVRLSDNQQAVIVDFDPTADFLALDLPIYSALIGNFASIGGTVTPVSGGLRLAAPSLDVTVLGGGTLAELLPRINPLT